MAVYEPVVYEIVDRLYFQNKRSVVDIAECVGLTPGEVDLILCELVAREIVELDDDDY